ncbi:beta-propeller fold lactonase family protein [Candidatus Daviesbacteria bacterium]|nr:beta-propeller fold lactonase family protein [Candidatus Daviesbacteria bacterium]
MNLAKQASAAFLSLFLFLTLGVTPSLAATLLTPFTSGGTNSEPDCAVLNPASTRLFVANWNAAEVKKLEVDNWTNVLHTTPVDAEPTGCSEDPSSWLSSNGVTYISNDAGKSLSIIDSSSGGLQQTVNFPDSGGQHGFAGDNDMVSYDVGTTHAHRIFVPLYKQNRVAVINNNNYPAAPTIMTYVTVGNSPLGVAVNPNNHHIYVANRDDNTISVINGLTNTVVNTLTTGNVPRGLVVDIPNNRLYVTNTTDNSVWVYDTTTETRVQIGGVNVSIPVGTDPRRVAVNTNSGHHHVYVSNYGSDSVSIIDPDNSYTVIQTIGLPTGSGPRGMEVNLTNNHVYVTNSGSGFNTVSEIDDN